jgi:hypothetical protein
MQLMRLQQVFVGFIFCFLAGCVRDEPSQKISKLNFRIVMRPSFHNSAEFEFLEVDSGIHMSCIMRERQHRDELPPEVYKSTQLICNDVHIKWIKQLIEKTHVQQPEQRLVMTDGMPVWYVEVKNEDTSFLYFRSARIQHDSLGFNTTRHAISMLKLIVQDSIVVNHVGKLESYISD